jgi:LPXTG-motif cell wall-anchored protein
VQVTGQQFPANTTIPILLDNTSTIGTAHVGADGSFSDPATLPADLSSGPHTISVDCATSGVESTTTVQVLGEQLSNSGSSSTPPLARTGTSSTEPLVIGGLAAVAVGAALVLTARRRRQSSAV